MDWRLKDILQTLSMLSTKSPAEIGSSISQKLSGMRSGVGVVDEAWGRLTLRANENDHTQLPDSISDAEYLRLLRKKLTIMCSPGELQEAMDNSVQQTILEK